MTKHDESRLDPTLDHAGRPKPWLCETKKQHVSIINAFECILVKFFKQSIYFGIEMITKFLLALG